MPSVERFFQKFAGREVLDGDIASFLYGPKTKPEQAAKAKELRRKWATQGALRQIGYTDGQRQPIFRVGDAPSAPMDTAVQGSLLAEEPLMRRGWIIWRLEKAEENGLYESEYADLHAKLCKSEGKRGILPDRNWGKLSGYDLAVEAAEEMGEFTAKAIAAEVDCSLYTGRSYALKMERAGLIERISGGNGLAAVYRWRGND